MFDIIIQNGTVVDGTGGQRYRADVALSGGIIAKIAPSIQGDAASVIDASGLIVSPGFIDCHTHSDGSILRGTDSYNYLEQGTTTELSGQCGGMEAPWYCCSDNSDIAGREEFRNACSTHASFLDYVDKNCSLGTNMAFFF